MHTAGSFCTCGTERTDFGPDDPPRTTRQKLLVEALDLFHERAFHAVGIDQVIARVGATKTTFYNHFEI